MLFLSLACAGNHDPVPPPPTPAEPIPPPTVPAPSPTPTAPAPTPTPSPAPTPEPIDGAALPGTWAGPPCGSRGWERTFVFAGDGTYHGQDPVSPCPPGVRCIWSGIIDFRGSWKVDGSALSLSEEAAPKAGEFTRPATLTMSGGSLYDPEGCRYDRKP